MPTGLVLEGGGMRGVYTAGALDCLLDAKIEFPYIAAVSAGACNATAYISKQRGRNVRVQTKYIREPRYLGLSSLLKNGSMFNYDFIIDEIGTKLEPLDLEAFLASGIRFLTGATDVATGKPVYFEKEVYRDSFLALRASCSIPFFSKIVSYDGRLLLDGGTADPIPIGRSIGDGNDRNVVIFTRHIGYRKKPEYSKGVCRLFYRKYPALVRVLETRHELYNRQVELCERLEREGRAVIVRPREPLPVGRYERDPKRLLAVYRLGYEDTRRLLAPIRKLIGAPAAQS